MFQNQVIAIFRNLKKNAVYTIINIIGLAIGLAACLFIVQYVNFELSYDQFHANKDNLYRLRFDRIYPEKHDRSAGSTAFIGPTLKEEIPEIIAYTKLWGTKHINNILSYNQQHFINKRLYYADSSFFNIFSYQLIKGDPKFALSKPYSIVLTEGLANKYFGQEDPIGKSIAYSGAYGKENYQVTGIVEDLPLNTHLAFEALVSFKTLVIQTEGNAHDSRGWSAFPTYLLLSPDADPQALEEKFDGFVERHMEEARQHNVDVKLLLQPVEDIHLKSNLRFESTTNGQAETVYFLFVIAIFILILAWINYINLSTSRAIDRSKEVAIRKVAGATRAQLIKQFLLEASVLNLLALTIALTFMQLLWPLFTQLIGKEIEMSLWTDLSLQLSFVGCFVFGVLLSGLYPAFVLSSFQPITMLKPAVKGLYKLVDLRKTLVVFQFVISTVLIIGTITVFKQLHFMRSQSIGIDIDHTLVVKGADNKEDFTIKFENFQNQLASRSDVLSISNATNIPGKEIGWINNDVRWAKKPETDRNALPHMGVNADFIKDFGIKLLHGRNFSMAQDQRKNRVILTKSATKLLGFPTPSDAVNEQIIDGQPFDVVGVVEDYHHHSLNQQIQPIIFRHLPMANSYYLIKIKSKSTQNTIDEISTIFQETFPASPFDYFFLDDYYNQQYQADQQFGKVFSIFSTLAIIIASMGLFGLSSFTINRMSKEIGIRKILGASNTNIFSMLSLTFIKISIIASIFALPLAYFGFEKWLQNYAYSIDISWLILTAPVAIIILINFSTIAFQTLKAAKANPVDSLRTD